MALYMASVRAVDPCSGDEDGDRDVYVLKAWARESEWHAECDVCDQAAKRGWYVLDDSLKVEEHNRVTCCHCHKDTAVEWCALTEDGPACDECALSDEVYGMDWDDIPGYRWTCRECGVMCDARDAHDHDGLCMECADVMGAC